MPLDVRSKACSYLRGGMVTVLQVSRSTVQQARPDHVYARVLGYSSTYIVRLERGVWTCTCQKPAECAHVAAVQLVTGHPSLAAPRKGAKR